MRRCRPIWTKQGRAGSVQAMYKLQKYVDESGLKRSLPELVKTRLSQMNSCAFCTDMPTKDARVAGETDQRLYGLSASVPRCLGGGS